MDAGTNVRMKNDPGRTGILTGRVRQIAGSNRYQVAFPDGSRSYYPDYELEVIGEGGDDEWGLLEAGRFGRVGDLRRNLTYIRLSGRLADLVYSMDTTNTRFFPHQFKPVLRFLDSPSNGLLIADEVGLGKTIEAGLIWTELRSRYDSRRLVVLCPAMLQDKWRDELRNRFGLDAQILDAKALLAELQHPRQALLDGRAVICSLQGARPPKGWGDPDNEELGRSARAKLARFLSERAGDEPLVDLLVIDEAHYLRNRDSQTHELGQLFREVSEHTVLLSATPINLNSSELFVLLNLIDPDSFHSLYVFPAVLAANAPLIQARQAALDRDARAADIVALLQQARDHHLLAPSRQLADLLDTPPTDAELADLAYRARLADRLERLNLLDGVVSRTRKREVQEFRVVRQPRSEFVAMYPGEAECYRLVTEAVRDYAIEHDVQEGFLLATPQRQMSSCMTAAVESWRSRTGFDDSLLYEDQGIEEGQEGVGQLVQYIAARVLPALDIAALRERDSKYERLRDVLVDFFKNHRDEKVVLFSYFRGTLHYLAQRLAQDGIPSRLLMGGLQDDKQEYIQGFRESATERVLLSSEVAAEGVDLQFCWVLVNYDLPWNPMRVEQRIGRIDRLGQDSPTVHIWNLGSSDTIDERIYNRLHLRLRIFEQALGGLESVLGDAIQRLTFALLTQKLTPEMEEERIRVTELAIERIRHDTEQLEEQASSLVAHGGYILEQVRAAVEFGRRIAARDLVVFVRDHLNRYFQGSEMRQVDDEGLVYDMKLSTEAAAALADFIKRKHLRGATRLVAGEVRPIRCEFRNKVDLPVRRQQELISQFHPLVRFVSADLKRRDDPFYKLVAMQIPRAVVPASDPGVYGFVIHLWVQEGIRVQEKLAFRVVRLDGNMSLLGPETSERLVSQAAIGGEDFLAAANLVDLSLLRGGLENCLCALEEDLAGWRRQSESENRDRVSFQLESARRAFQRHLDTKQRILEGHRLRGRASLVKATQGQIDKLRERFRMREEELRLKERLASRYEEVCMGVLRVH